MDIVAAKKIVGGLSKTTKMPCFSYSIPAKYCKVGSKLRKVKGSVCSKCYAMRGKYNFTVVKRALDRRLKSISKPEWAEAMATLINHSNCKFFRWHDSGDLQNMEHLLKIIEVCKLTPTAKHWLPTKEIALIVEAHKSGIEFPDNLVVRISVPMIDGEIPNIGSANVLYSMVHSEIPRDGAYECKAQKRGNRCLNCRACWNKNIKLVSYHQH